MKRIIVMSVMFSSAVAHAQKVDASRVPDQVKNTFAQKFPDVKSVKWEIEKANYEANFKNDEHSKAALFNVNGQMIEDETSIKVNELPKGVMDYVNKTHSGATIKEAAIIKLANGEINYEAEVNGEDLVFDAKGAFLKAVKD